MIHEETPSNISVDRKISYGDLEKGFAESDYVREDTFTVQAVSPAYLEPCACLAPVRHRRPDHPVDLDPDPLHRPVPAGLHPGHARKRHPGDQALRGRRLRGQDGAAALGVLRRLHGAAHRPAGQVHPHPRRRAGLRPPAAPDDALVQGRLQKRRHPGGQGPEVLLDGGAYNAMGPTATFLCGNFGAMLYRYPNYRFLGQHVYTNKPPASAMRGFGAPQSLFAGRDPDEHGRRSPRHRPHRPADQKRHGHRRRNPGRGHHLQLRLQRVLGGRAR